NSLQSNFDQTAKISKSVFISNFPDDCSNRDLWKVCSGYDTVVDVFIPNKRSKTGKRFAFVRFIKVLNFDPLIENLKTIWIGRFHISVNPARFERPKAPIPQKQLSTSGLKQPTAQHKSGDLAKCVMGEVRQFSSINNLQGELVDLEDGYEDLFARKCICVITSHTENILESFKLIVKGKVFWASAKELFVWSPSFKEVPEREIFSDDESIKTNEDANNLNLGDAENDSEVVSDTYFGDNGEDQGVDQHQAEPSKVQEYFVPPGFTPINDIPTGIQDNPVVSSSRSPIKSARRNSSPCQSNGLSSRVMKDTVPADVYTSPVGSKSKHGSHKGGSMLEVLDGMIKVGQAMGFSIDGFLKDMEIMIGSQGAWGILCLWDPLMFHKDHHIISDNFVVLYGTWVPNNAKLLIVSVYAPQSATDKRLLWSYITGLLSRWKGEVLVTGDFKEVRFERERLGFVFNVWGANEFNSFMSNAGLVEIQLEGFSFTWSHPSAAKMSKLDRFLVSEGFLSLFPHISTLCLDKNLSDHRPILLHELVTDYGATPFRLYHSWFYFHGFDDMVRSTWNSFVLEDSNGMVRFKKKLQMMKKEIRSWVADHKRKQTGRLIDIQDKLSNIDHTLDQGGASDEILLSRMELMKQMLDIKSIVAREQIQKAKIQWAIEGDENSKFFHGVVNRKRVQLSVKDVMIDGEWVDEPDRVKEEFRSHFANRFQDKGSSRCRLNFRFPSLLSADQISDLEKPMSCDEIRKAFWSCGENKSPGPDGFTFEFFRKFWDSIGPDMCVATAFLPNRQILDGPFIINELLSWCRHKKQQAMVFKVDFAKAYYSVRWDYLDDVLFFFGFGVKWRSWIKGSLTSGMASVLVNGSPRILISLRFETRGSFGSVSLHSCYGIAPLVGFQSCRGCNLWSIIHMLHCFSLASGLKINLQKSNLLGVGVNDSLVNEVAGSIGCSVMKAPFKYLGAMVGSRGRLTLLKAVLGSTPIYPMSLYKVPKSVLHEMESLRRNFFNGAQGVDRKISWVKWSKVLAFKKFGGLGVSSFFALNRALLFRWVWRFLSHDNSLWFRFISAMHGSSIQSRSSSHCSNWLSILREVSALKLQGIDFLSHYKRRIGSVMQTHFWEDLWLGETHFRELFPRLYALENNKDCSVAVKMQDARDLVDEVLLPKENVATRWIKTIPIKVNVFAWKLCLDRLPTRSNLFKRGVQVQSSLCPLCNTLQEDTSHLFFSCDVASAISRRICRWWNVSWGPADSYLGWLEWFTSIRMGHNLKGILEGVFYVSWWCLWNFRNQLLIAAQKPRKETLFDDIVSLSFIWSNSRCTIKFTWDCWLEHPYSIAL
nr:putative RNA-directed DNA polymerase, eukaryota, reverse transcriptase zinc-binding domain protein [Tanacetum cinerariifolium]